MSQFCILFYANYTILATQRGKPWPNGPPKYAPARIDFVVVLYSAILCFVHNGITV